MNYNLLKKIFPFDNCKSIGKLKFDSEGLWSISYPESADFISDKIKIFEKSGIKFNTILDATAGLGGNTLSFAKNFETVLSCELSKERYEILKNNIDNYKYNNIRLYNMDCLEIINSVNSDVVFFDPPWGGPNYKYEDKIEITLSGLTMSEICNIVCQNKEVKLIVFKFPYNYDYEEIVNNCKNFIKVNHVVKDGNINYLFLLINSKIE